MGSLFRERYVKCKSGPFQGKGMQKGYLFRERFSKKVQGIVSERGANFRNLVCESLRSELRSEHPRMKSVGVCREVY